MLNCPKCNSVIPNDSGFCQFCGTEINIKPSAEGVTQQTVVLGEAGPFYREHTATHTFVSSEKIDSPIHNPKKPQDRYCKMCGGHIDRQTKKCESCGKQYFKFKSLTFAVIILAVFLVASVGLNLYQNNYIQENRNMFSKIGELQTEIKKLTSEKSKLYTELNSELSFYRENAAIVNGDGSKKYHKYGCEDCDTSSFWIYGIEFAEVRGYSACPKCH